MNDTKPCSCMEYFLKGNSSNLILSNEVYSIYGNLNKGEKITLKYFGNLIKDTKSNETKIFLNYGYGNLWDNKNICEMNLCSNSDFKCYCTSFELANTENLFFCFMDDNNNWDLNNNSSYMITIDTPINVLTKKTSTAIISEDEYISSTGKFFKRLTNSLIKFFGIIGNMFSSKTRTHVI